MRLILDLDLQLRMGAQWDPSNTLQLLKYIRDRKYGDVFNFELGNGASGLRHVYVTSTSRLRYIRDFMPCPILKRQSHASPTSNGVL